MSMVKNERNPKLVLYYDAEAADILRVSTRTLQMWRTKGTGPKWSRVGRLVYYRESDLIEWLEERQRGHTERPYRKTATSAEPSND